MNFTFRKIQEIDPSLDYDKLFPKKLGIRSKKIEEFLPGRQYYEWFEQIYYERL